MITGAGASRELGVGDSPMPLMADWATALCAELDARGRGPLAAAIGLSVGMDGVAFEAKIGRFLAWYALEDVRRELTSLISVPVRPGVGQAWQPDEGENARAVIGALRTSLWREFGAAAIDGGRAVATYRGLLEQLGECQWVFVATTNYDVAHEAGLVGQSGLRVADGTIPAQVGRRPRVDSGGTFGAVASGEADVAIIHLHGAAGWTRADDGTGDIIVNPTDQPYRPDLGDPVVLYPDPDKEPGHDALIQMLWEDLDQALHHASHVLVIGHSLNDAPLLARVRAAAGRGVPTLIVDPSPDAAERHPAGTMHAEVGFGPNTSLYATDPWGAFVGP